MSRNPWRPPTPERRAEIVAETRKLAAQLRLAEAAGDERQITQLKFAIGDLMVEALGPHPAVRKSKDRP